MLRLLISIFVFLGFACSSYGQSYIKQSSKKLKSKFAKSAQLASQNKYEEAIKLCNQILKKEKDNLDVLLRRSSYLASIKKFSAAEKGFKEAINLNPSYDPRMYYSLGKTQFALKNYEEASTNFGLFLQHNKKESSLVKKAHLFQSQSSFIAEAIKNPVPFDPVRMDPEINTNKWECLPYLSADGSSLLYLTIDPKENDPSKKQRLYSSQFDGNKFLKGEPFSGFNYPFGEGAHCLSPNGQVIVFTSCDFGNSPKRTSYGGCDLYISYFDQGKWTTPRNLGNNVNTRYWDSQPTISSDNKSIIFSSKRKGGLGGADLYETRLMSNGEWSKASNLGEQINTTGDDESPFMHPDGQSFYFRSNGRVGMGDFDIYMCTRKKGKWSEVKNLGYPINTVDDDGALFVSLNGEKAYFTSNRSSEESDASKNDLDIFSFDLPSAVRPIATTFVKGKIMDAKTKSPVKSTIEIDNEEEKRDIKTNEKGEFIITLPTQKNYAFHVQEKGYLLKSDRFELKNVNTAHDPFLLVVDLIPIEKNDNISIETKEQPILLKNIFFESGKFELLNASLNEINKLAQMLRSNPSMIIEVHGHTDNVGPENENLELSNQRALAVKNALIDLGCPSTQIKHKGYGESKPIASNETEEGKKLNRRTEFIILKK